MNTNAKNPAHHVLTRGIVITTSGEDGKIEVLPVASGQLSAGQAIAALFQERYEAISLEVPYNPEWGNGTGYFDGAVKDPAVAALLPVGAMGRCTDEYNRKMILIGTSAGTVVIFPRYSDDNQRLVYNMPFAISKLELVDHGLLQFGSLYKLVGGGAEPNVGEWFETLKAWGQVTA